MNDLPSLDAWVNPTDAALADAIAAADRAFFIRVRTLMRTHGVSRKFATEMVRERDASDAARAIARVAAEEII